MGGYSEDNISGGTSARAGSSQKRQRIAQDAGGYIKHPDPGHCMVGGLSEVQTQDMSSQRVGYKRHLNSYQKDIWRAIPKAEPERKTEEYGISQHRVFIQLLFWPLDRGARKRNSGKYLRLVGFRQIVQAMVCREVPAVETGFWRVLRQHKTIYNMSNKLNGKEARNG